MTFIALVGAIGLFVMLWLLVASVLFPWADKMQSRHEPKNQTFIDDVLRERDPDGDPR